MNDETKNLLRKQEIKFIKEKIKMNRDFIKKLKKLQSTGNNLFKQMMEFIKNE